MIGKKLLQGQWYQIRGERKLHRKHNYYDQLGITPKATQADIKKAFYKLSMKFHPDKATGDDAKFREINTAYEVLGNLKLRRLYDKGNFPVGAVSASPPPNVDDDEVDQREFYREQSGKKRDGNWVPPSGRTDAYNFDEWTRRHYSDLFGNATNARERKFGRRSRQEVSFEELERRYRHQHRKQDSAELMVLGGIILVLSLIVYRSTFRNFDVPLKKPPKDV